MKSKIGNQNMIYPMPVTIVGALVDDQINFINIAHVGILNARAPHLISLGMNKCHFTNSGIKETKTFSINILSTKQVIEADYVGLVSGKQTKKSDVFQVFYGDLKTAPMIKDCPLSMECRLVDIYDTKTHDVLIGEIVSTYADDEVLSEGKVDISKVDPLLFDMSNRNYWSLGEIVGKCWSEGKKYIQQG